MTEVAGFRTGRSRPSPGDARRLSLAAVLNVSTLPTPPSSISAARHTAIAAIQYPMMGNDRYGDCTVASAGHVLQADTTYEHAPFVATTDQVVSEYLALGNGQDNGLMLTDVLSAWKNAGLWGHTLAAYAEVPWTDQHLSAAQTRRLLRLSVYLFGAAYVAVGLPYGMQRNPYDWVTVGTGPDWRPGSWGGHAIPILTYQSPGGKLRFFVVTWGRLVEVSEAFLRAFMDEAYAVVTPEWANKAGKSPNGRPVSTLVSMAAQLTAA